MWRKVTRVRSVATEVSSRPTPSSRRISHTPSQAMMMATPAIDPV
jgi:hypothetical protein